MALTLAGCVGGGEATEPSGLDTAVTVGLDDPRVTTLPTVPSDSLQAEILADGEVSNAEMERALLAVVACVRDGGYRAELTGFVPGDGWTFEVGAESAEEADRAEARFTLCSARFLSDVEAIYLAANSLTEAEIEQRNRAILECLAAEGLDVEGMSSVGEFLVEALDDEALGAFARCEEQQR